MDFRRKRLRIGVLVALVIAGCVGSRQKLQELAPEASAWRDPGPWNVKYHHHVYRYRAEFGPFMTSELGPAAYPEHALKDKVVQTAHFSEARMISWHELITADGDRVRLEVGSPPTESVKLGPLKIPGAPNNDKICMVSRGDQQIAEIRCDFFRNSAAPEELGKIVTAEKTILIKVDKPVHKELLDELFNRDFQLGFYDGEERIAYLAIRPEPRVWMARELPRDTKVLIAAACSVGLEIQKQIEMQEQQESARSLQMTSSQMMLRR